MNRTAAQIAQARLIVTGVIRALAIMLCYWILLGWVNTFQSALQSGDFLDDLSMTLGYTWAGVLAQNGFVLVIFWKAGWIARMLVRFPREPLCPKCRFSLEHFRADRCPECGLYLGSDFHAPPAPAESVQSETPASQVDSHEGLRGGSSDRTEP